MEKKHKKTKIYGKNIYLMPITTKHLPTCWKWINDKEVTEYLGGPFAKTYQEEIKWFQEVKKNNKERLFGIFDKHDNKYIGNIGIHGIDNFHKKAQVGIMIGEKEYWSKGYGTDAMKTALSYGFDILKLNKISLNVNIENIGAQKSYKKCGYQEIGIAKEELFTNGKFYDAILMEIMTKDFKNP
ncbi:GNAT family N-acetyltransferase [Patescibacteria group bacterium]